MPNLIRDMHAFLKKLINILWSRNPLHICLYIYYLPIIFPYHLYLPRCSMWCKWFSSPTLHPYNNPGREVSLRDREWPSVTQCEDLNPGLFPARRMTLLTVNLLLHLVKVITGIAAQTIHKFWDWRSRRCPRSPRSHTHYVYKHP